MLNVVQSQAFVPDLKPLLPLRFTEERERESGNERLKKKEEEKKKKPVTNKRSIISPYERSIAPSLKKTTEGIKVTGSQGMEPKFSKVKIK